MTAVEYLIDTFENPHLYKNVKWEDVKIQAKEMEKQQIIDAYAQGFIESETIDKGAEKYYNETYGSKKIRFTEEEWAELNNGSKGNDNDVETNEMVYSQITSDKWKEYQDWLNEVPEISDEEIEKAAEDWQEFRQGAGKQSFEQGAKWYREKLKKRQ